MTQSVAVEGVTQSRGMALVAFQHPCGSGDSLLTLPGLMAANQKNINLFVGTELEGRIQVTSCMAGEDSEVIRQRADGGLGLRGDGFRAVLLVSVFPHRFSLKTAGLVLTALAKAEVPVHGFCSSLSALTFIIPDPYAAKADAALRECFHLRPVPSL